MSKDDFFTLEFQHMVLASVLRDTANQNLYLNVIEPKLFTETNSQQLFKYIKKHAKKYKVSPSFATIREILKQNSASVEMAELVGELETIPLSEDFTRDSVVQYVTHQKCVKGVERLVNRLEAKDYDGFSTTARKLVSNTDHTSIGMMLKREVSERDKARKDGVYTPPKVPTGISLLDNEFLSGGVCRGEMLIITAPSNYGKSMLLCNFGASAMELGYKVSHITLEMSDKVVANRYDSIITNIKKRTLADHDVANVFMHTVFGWPNQEGEVCIKQFPTYGVSLEGIEAYLELLEASEGFVPDVIIVDYGELVAPPNINASEHKQFGDIYGGLRAIGTRRNAVMLSGSQATRSAIRKEIVGMEHTGKSLMIAQHADVQLTLMATKKELDEGQMRLGVPKNREDKKPQSRGLSLVVNWDVQRVERAEIVDILEEENKKQATEGKLGKRLPPTEVPVNKPKESEIPSTQKDEQPDESLLSYL